MAEYIEREAAVKMAVEAATEIFDCHTTLPLLKVANKIRTIPTADVVEVKHGEWEKDVNFSKIVNKYKCSLCGVEDIVLHHNYCPNCGAKMDLKEGVENE